MRKPTKNTLINWRLEEYAQAQENANAAGIKSFSQFVKAAALAVNIKAASLPTRDQQLLATAISILNDVGASLDRLSVVAEAGDLPFAADVDKVLHELRKAADFVLRMAGVQ